MRWFISDFHFGHNKPFIYESRGFSSIEEHDEELIRRFNSIVNPKDVTYHLGDFCWMSVNRYLSRLNGRLIIIYGNHDKTLREFLKAHPERVDAAYEGYHNMYIGSKQPITLCHFAMHSWEKSHYNAMHIYGHHHSKTDFGGKTLNVSVDSLDGYPISEKRLLQYMAQRPDNWDYLGRGFKSEGGAE